MKQFIRHVMKSFRFSRDQDGSIIVFVMVTFSAMFLAGGTAIDLARHENLRATLQYNLDRAVLAAASLKQEKSPKDVIDDYMSRVVAISEFSINVDSSVSVNARSVSATATTELDMWFLSMAGIDKMSITTQSRAEERVPQLEISLVLDVSGSMSGGKLASLKVAAKQFVTAMLTDADPDSVSISIVPFTHSVSPNTSIFEALTVDQTHTMSTCLEFDDSDFSSTAIDPFVPQTQAIYTSLYGGFQSFSSSHQTCYTQDAWQILPFSASETQLHTKIDGLQAGGWTAAHLGMKWGTALLDPTFRPVVDHLIAKGEVATGFAGAPVEYTDTQTRKVIVLMGDGANTYEFRFGKKFRGGDSGLWEVTTANPTEKKHYFLRKPKNGRHYALTTKTWLTGAEWGQIRDAAAQLASGISGNGTNNSNGNGGSNIDPNAVIGGVKLATITESRLFNWEEAWTLMTPQFFDSITGEDALDDVVNQSSRMTDAADAVMFENCQAAEDAGIVVFTIGYQTDQSTSGKLRKCASSVSHYYDAAIDDIDEVFASIARSIQKLKLTQ